MGVPVSRDLSQHKQVAFYQSTIARTPSPDFSPPVPAYMREPGTNWYTIITASGPHNLERP
jgi:hypothetical protein